MIAKLVTHGATRDQAIDRMHDALDAYLIRRVATNLAFLSNLTRHPRFRSGDLETSLIAEAYPDGFQPAIHPHEEPLLLATVAAFVRRRYIQRAVATSGQLEGHGRRVDRDWIVLDGDERWDLALDLNEEGCEIEFRGQTHRLHTSWKIVEPMLLGTWDGREVCVQVERVGLRYRVSHAGSVLDALVMTGRAVELMDHMPHKFPPDHSKMLLSPMPGLLVELADAGRHVRPGESLAVVEAMKMRNILKAERDGVVAEILASPGSGVAVDQPILRFE